MREAVCPLSERTSSTEHLPPPETTEGRRPPASKTNTNAPDDPNVRKQRQRVCVKVAPHHACALTVADVGIQPRKPSQDPPELGHPHTRQSVEACISGHGPQKILFYLQQRQRENLNTGNIGRWQ